MRPPTALINQFSKRYECSCTITYLLSPVIILFTRLSFFLSLLIRLSLPPSIHLSLTLNVSISHSQCIYLSLSMYLSLTLNVSNHLFIFPSHLFLSSPPLSYLFFPSPLFSSFSTPLHSILLFFSLLLSSPLFSLFLFSFITPDG